jgi:AraC-like DNA-binding protein
MVDHRWFRPSAPLPARRSLFACRWTASIAGRHLLVPDGSMDVVWIEGRGLWLCGPDTSAWAIEVPASTDCVGVRFHPGAAAGTLNIDAAETVDRRLSLDAVTGARAARIIDEQIHEAKTSHRRAEVLERLIAQLGSSGCSRADAPDVVIQAAVRTLAVTDRRVHHLAEQTDLSARQLQRRFVRHVGYPPSQFARIARLQRFMHRSSARPTATLADLATCAGYADQAHLARDCRALADLTPTELRAAVATTSHADPAALVDAERGNDRPGVRSVQDGRPTVEQYSAA